MSLRSERDQAIAELATQQHGVVSRSQLHAIGLTDNAIAGRVRSARLHRIHPGVYSIGHAALSPLGQLMAAHLAGGPASAISHLTAANEWRISRYPRSRVDLLIPRAVQRTLDGVDIHRTTTLPTWHTQRRDGIRRTTVERTIIDLTDVLTEWQLTNVLNDAKRRRKLNLRSVERLMSQVRGRHGLLRVRRAIAMHQAGSAGTKSELEDLCLDRLLAAGFPEPIVNVEVGLDHRSWEMDFHWIGYRVDVEVDGSGHDVPYRSANDIVRDRALEAAGWTVLRYTGDEVRFDFPRIASEVRAALTAGR